MGLSTIPENWFCPFLIVFLRCDYNAFDTLWVLFLVPIQRDYHLFCPHLGCSLKLFPLLRSICLCPHLGCKLPFSPHPRACNLNIISVPTFLRLNLLQGSRGSNQPPLRLSEITQIYAREIQGESRSPRSGEERKYSSSQNAMQGLSLSVGRVLWYLQESLLQDMLSS